MKSFLRAIKGAAFAAAIFGLAILGLAIAYSVLPRFAVCQSHSGSNKASGAGPHKLLAVKATGTTRYTDQEILAASGLELGQDAAEGDFQEAARRLGNSGLFSEVVYSFSYTDTGVKVEFQLTDIDKSKLVPAHFENFVWFTEFELRASLAQRVSLFKEMMPASGQLTDRVAKALQALLDERRLPGRVDYLREGQQDGGDITGIDYRVEDISIHIRKVEFPGVPSELAALLTERTHNLTGAEYSRAKLATVAQYDLLPLFLERGYLKAEFSPADAHVVAPPSTQPEDKSLDERPQDEVEVDAVMPVTPGKVYSVSGVSWNGNSAVKTEEAGPLIHLAPGKPADAVRLAHDVENLIKLYHSRGYMKAEIKPDAKLDDEERKVSYSIEVTEGDLYRMGEIEFLGIDTPSKDRLREAWTLREGQPYNADYTRKFLDNAPRLLPKGLQYSAKINEELDAKDKTVDVTIHFRVQ